MLEQDKQAMQSERKAIEDKLDIEYLETSKSNLQFTATLNEAVCFNKPFCQTFYFLFLISFK